MHLGLTGTAWALGSYRISQHLSTLRALGSVFLPLLYFLVSLLYFCCSFLSGSFVIFYFIFFFFPVSLCRWLIFFPPQKKKIFTVASSSFSFQASQVVQGDRAAAR